MPSFFDYLERFVVCISPIIIAWFGYRANKNEKQTKKYMEAQEELKKANEELKNKESEELQHHLNKLDKSINDLTTKVNRLDSSISSIGEIDTRLNNLVEMSNANFEFCSSLSTVISSIGNALDSSDVIESGNLKHDLAEHQKTERALISKVCRIIY